MKPSFDEMLAADRQVRDHYRTVKSPDQIGNQRCELGGIFQALGSETVDMRGADASLPQGAKFALPPPSKLKAGCLAARS